MLHFRRQTAGAFVALLSIFGRASPLTSKSQKMTAGVKQVVKMALLRAHHRRNEALRHRFGQNEGIAASEWGARYDDAGQLDIDSCNVASLAREFGTPLH